MDLLQSNPINLNTTKSSMNIRFSKIHVCDVMVGAIYAGGNLLAYWLRFGGHIGTYASANYNY